MGDETQTDPSNEGDAEEESSASKPKKLSKIEEAKQVLKEIKEATAKSIEAADRLESLQAEATVSGQADAGRPSAKKDDIAEEADAIMNSGLSLSES